MGNQILEPSSTSPKEVYRLITFKGRELPLEFRNLIIAPFLNSLRYGNDLFKLIDKESYYDNYARYIETLLSRNNSHVKLAVLDDETVLGWCLYQDKTVHYIWVKKEVRRQGIGKSLLPKDFTSISHITNKGINIWVNKYPEVSFNPWA